MKEKIEALYDTLELFERHELILTMRMAKDVLLLSDQFLSCNNIKKGEYLFFFEQLEDTINGLYYCRASFLQAIETDKIVPGDKEEQYHLENLSNFVDIEYKSFGEFKEEVLLEKIKMIIGCVANNDSDIPLREVKFLCCTLYHLILILFDVRHVVPGKETGESEVLKSRS